MAYKKIEQQLWNAEDDGEEIEGTISSINKDGVFGAEYSLKKNDGTIVLLPAHKVLQNRLVSCVVGDKIKVVFVKEEAPKIKGHNPTRLYDVFKDE